MKKKHALILRKGGNIRKTKIFRGIFVEKLIPTVIPLLRATIDVEYVA